MTIPTVIIKNFNMLLKAVNNKDVCLVEVTEVATGATRYAVCAVNVGGASDPKYDIVPFALMIDGDPYAELVPPRGSSIDVEDTMRGGL